MCRKSPGLSELLAREIASAGPLTFARYLEIVLYDPGFGYYASGRAAVGRGGDFYTNVSVGPVFGRVLALQLAEMWERLGRPRPFVLVEQGANDGALARDVALTLRNLLPPAEIALRIVEPSATLAARQRETLSDLAGSVEWFPDLAALPPFAGVHFSNELIDALPFHLLRSTRSGWEELFVAGEPSSLTFVGGPATVETAILPARPAGTLAELRPMAPQWLRDLSSRLLAGYILVIDYGYPRDLLYASHRSEGTFQCYRAHRRDGEPLADPGEKDITAHVDFTALAETASATGLAIEGFCDQHHFLIGAGEGFLREFEGRTDPASRQALRGFQTLLHPETMGTQFHYLALSRNVPHSTPLAGFRFRQGPNLLPASA